MPFPTWVSRTKRMILAMFASDTVTA
jgi:hypothetical protein